MKRKPALLFAYLAVAALTLMVNFFLYERLILALVTLLPVGAMVWARRASQSWLAHLSLAGFTGLSALGALLDIPLIPMVFATCAALASWDLVLEMQVEFPTTEFYERLHLKFLGAALGLGLLGAGVFQWIHWQLSFIVMLGLGILLLVCLNRVISYIQQFLTPKR